MTHIIVFARAPVPGFCKTRLIPKYGARGAAQLHRRLVRGTLATVCAMKSARVELWCEPDTGHGFFLALRRQFGFVLRAQPAGDLGRKMALALTRTLARGENKVLLVGTDCAALRTADLRTASAALDHSDAVLQPSEDGGYVLIGAKCFATSALRGVRWSSGDELRQTCARLANRGISCALMPELWDVDFPRDVRRARLLGLL